jgi:subtilase family serine protease
MAHLRSLPLYIVASALFCCSALMAQEYAPKVRIVNRIDASQLVTLKGNTHPSANAKNDRGQVSSTLPMTDLILVLSRDADQQAAFDKFVASQYEQGSANFHHWLTPEEVGEKFGPSQTDIATISNWLTGQGFSVDAVSKDRMSIRFSGTAGQVESAFHTEIHNLDVKGVPHIANMSDPQIPAALAPAVVGVKALHNFFPKPLHKLGSLVTRDSQTGKWTHAAGAEAITVQMKGASRAASIRPQFGVNDPTNGLVEDVTPYDFATIYNVLPLWTASTPIDGTGQTIAIAGTSSIVPSDVTSFRTIFGLPTSGAANTPKIVSGNSMPITVCSGTSTTVPYPGNYCNVDDQTENALDTEWSGAVAKGAQIVLVSSYPASASDDALFDSESYIISNKATLNASIMNVSYGECELFMGTAGNAEYNTLWQTAAGEGIAVFVSSGDEGSASCDAGLDTSTPYAAEYGLSVSGMASTPYNTAVGGTDLNWGSTASPYWGTSNSAANGSNALGYMPEVPWNDTCTNPIVVASINSQLGTSLTATQICDELYTEEIYSNSRSGEASLLSLIDVAGGSGGVSSCTTSNGTSVSSCSGGYAKPTWQTGVTGMPSDGKRDIPDVSFFASNGFLGSAYLVCVSANGACVNSTTITTEPTAQEIGGTSASSPAMAGVMALINQKAGAAQGSPNTQLYTLAAKQTYSSCSAEQGSGSPVTSTSCYFNDIDTGTIAMPCDYSDRSPNCVGSDYVGILSGYTAAAGYDLATGLGSLNVANVVNAWVSDAGTGTATVAVTPTTATIAINNSLTLTVAVAGSGSLGTPTGTVLLSGGGYSATQTIGTSPCTSAASCVFTIPANSLTAGSYNLTATYSGDSNYASNTATTAVTVNVMTPTVTVSAPSSGNVANVLSVPVTVTGPTGATAVPSGTVSISVSVSGNVVYTSGATQLTVGTSSATATLVIPANKLSAGQYTVTVNYSGDSNYASGAGTAQVTMVETPTLTPTVNVSAAPNPVETGQPLTVTVSVTGSGATPTGTLSLSSGSYSSGAQTIGVSPCTSAASCVFTIPANKLSVGNDTLTVAYSGDSIYVAGPGTGSVTVTPSAFTLSASTPAAVSPGGSTTSTVTVTSTTNYTGTITFTSCTVTTAPTNASYTPTCTPSGTVAMTNGVASGTATLNITTTAASSELVWPKLGGKGRGWTGAGGGAVLAFLVLLGVPRRKRNWLSMLGVLVMMAALGSLAGCGGGGSSSGTSISGTTAGAYTFTVTGTGNDVANTTEQTTFTLTVN